MLYTMLMISLCTTSRERVRENKREETKEDLDKHKEGIKETKK